MKIQKLMLWTFCFLSCMIQSTQVFSCTTEDVFRKYPNPVFIETGSYKGGGIQKALNVGFSEIHSIELSHDLYEYCKQRFANKSNVYLYQGDSSIVLKDVLENIDQRATFWLDGHFSTGNRETVRGDCNTPIYRELAIIGEHPIKNHTILIDDIRLFGTEEFEYADLEQAIEIIKTINPAYQIHYENGVCANDVLVAEVP